MSDVWMVRAGRDSVYVDDFLELELVAIGWDELGPIEEDETKSQLLRRYQTTYPDQSAGSAQTGVSQVLRFLKEIKVGDTVVTYDRDRRIYYIGKVLSQTMWSPDKVPNMPRVRQVNWTHRVLRDRLSVDTKNTLGAIQTLFQVKKRAADELLEKAVPINEPEKEITAPPVTIPPASDGTTSFEQEIGTNSLERVEESIEERIVRLDWESIQQLVAGILRAPDTAPPSRPWRDRGVDIFASPDGLGLKTSYLRRG